MKVSNNKIEGLHYILESIGTKRHPMLAWKVSLLNQFIEVNVKAIVVACQPTTEYHVFKIAMDALTKSCAKCGPDGEPLSEVSPSSDGRGPRTQYTIEDPRRYSEGLQALQREHLVAIQAEDSRRSDQQIVMETEVDLEFPCKIKYSWCKELLSGNDLTLLLSLGILETDEEPEEEVINLKEPTGDASEESKE